MCSQGEDFLGAKALLECFAKRHVRLHHNLKLAVIVVGNLVTNKNQLMCSTCRTEAGRVPLFAFVIS